MVVINHLKQIKMKVKSAVIKFKLMENKSCINGTYPIYLIVQFNGRSVEGISTYVADIKSSEQLMKERMKLIL